MGTVNGVSIDRIDQRDGGILAVILDGLGGLGHDDEIVVLALVADLGDLSFSASHDEDCLVVVVVGRKDSGWFIGSGSV